MQRRWASSYQEGVPLRLEPSEETTVSMLDRSLTRYADHVALEFFGRETTYAQFDDQVQRAAEGLRRMGVSAGDRVAVVLPNCPAAHIAFYSVQRLGATVVAHNPLYTENELAYPFYDHGARVAIVWDKIVPMMNRLRQTSKLENIVAVDLTRAMPLTKQVLLRLPVASARTARDKLTGPSGRALSWDRLLSTPRLSVDHPRPSADDPALILYTSGTTGTPKGAVLTHRNLMANAQMGVAWVTDLRPGQERLLAVLPPFHAYGVTFNIVFAMLSGARVILLPTPDIDLIMKVFEKQPPTFLPAVPPLYSKILEESHRRGISLMGVRNSFSGAMSLPGELVRRWHDATGGTLVEGYGTTEASPVAAGNPMNNGRPGSVGLPFPETEIRLTDKDDPTLEVPLGEPGELQIRGPQVFAGYLNMPEKTAETIVDGWLRTGDVAIMGDDGFLRIVDRIKEMVITGGFNVYPSEVEKVLCEHPSVEEAVVFGHSHEDGSETVAAAVVLSQGARLDPPSLIEHCRGELARYKVPREYVALEEIPTNVLGKVVRKDVAAAHQNDLTRG